LNECEKVKIKNIANKLTKFNLLQYYMNLLNSIQNFAISPSIYVPPEVVVPLTLTQLRSQTGLTFTPSYAHVATSTNGTTIYMSYGNTNLIKSTNSGTNWTTITSFTLDTNGRIEQVVCNADGTIVAFFESTSSSKAAFYSVNGGTSWTKGQSFTTMTPWAYHTINFSHILFGAAGNYGTLTCSFYNGTTRTQSFLSGPYTSTSAWSGMGGGWSGSDGFVRQYQPSNDGTRIYSIPGVTNSQSDKNTIWVSLYSTVIDTSTPTFYMLSGFPALAYPTTYTRLALNMNSNNYVLAFTSASQLILSNNAHLLNSSTGTVLSNSSPFTLRTNTIRWVDVSYTGQFMCALTTTGLYYSKNFGVKWYYYELDANIIWDTAHFMNTTGANESILYITGHTTNTAVLHRTDVNV